MKANTLSQRILRLFGFAILLWIFSMSISVFASFYTIATLVGG